jgi:archaellum component FlaC
MENLKILLDSYPLSEVNQATNQFVHSADGYNNKLKLTFVLLNLIHEEIGLLQSVNSSEFISDIRERVEELNQQAGSLAEEYHAQLLQNNEIQEILSDKKSTRVSDIQAQIDSLLQDYDKIIKALVEIRDSLSIEKQLEQEKK